jgi:PAS domain S-box-containing protein
MIPEQGEGLFGMAFEITGAPVSSERRRSTPNKREKELLQILEATTDGIWQWNLRDHKILLSSKYYAMLGYEPGEFAADFETWREMIHPADRECAVAAIRDFVRGATVEYRNEFRFRARSGGYHWIRAGARVVERDDQGHPVKVIGNHQDITDLRHADEMIRENRELHEKLTDLSFAGIYLIEKGEIRFLNSRAASMMECVPGELVGHRADQFIHPDDRESAGENARKMLRGELNAPYEFRIITKSGKTRWVMEALSAIFAGGERLVLGNAMDITERKAEEEKRKFLERQLQKSQRMEALGTLSGGIAHDFNNILSSLMGFTELAMRESRANKRLAYLGQVMQACERAKNLTTQILDFSRREEEGKKPFDVRVIIKETLKLLKASLPATIRIRSEITMKPATILADPTQIHQIMMNLCTNAAHAMHEKGGVLQIQLSVIEANRENLALLDADLKAGPYIRLKISDTGHGIAPADLDRIFHPFFTTKKPGEGTGLGLSVVYGIVKNHGGAIGVESGPGTGTAFTVYLPYVAAEMVAGEKKPPGPVPSGQERILFVDDESAIVEAAENYLRSMGYNVIATCDSLEALEIFRQRPDRIDLVITDMTMPRLTGLELSKELLAIRQDLPIILCSGYNQSIQEKLLKQLGVRHFVKKPVTLADLNRRVRQVLDESHEN